MKKMKFRFICLIEVGTLHFVAYVCYTCYAALVFTLVCDLPLPQTHTAKS